MELKTKMWLYNTEGHIRTGKVVIKWGIFQGDSLSVLLLCLALTSITTMFNKQGAGYEVKEENKVSHLCYMDDFKLFSRYKTKLQQDLTTVKTFTNGIRMQSGIDKCTTAVFKHGKITKSQTISLNSQTVITHIYR